MTFVNFVTIVGTTVVHWLVVRDYAYSNGSLNLPPTKLFTPSRYDTPRLNQELVVERPLMVRWLVGSIVHGRPTELFLVPARAPRLVKKSRGM